MKPKGTIHKVRSGIRSLMVVVIGCSSLDANCLGKPVSPQCARPKASTESVQLEGKLEKTAQEFVSVLQNGVPSDMARFWSQFGVTFGVDGDETSEKQFRQQLQTKGYLYCLLFDGACLRAHVSDQRQKAGLAPRFDKVYSYRELLNQPQSRSIRVSVTNGPEALHGQVRVNGQDENGKRTLSLEFMFVYEKGCWKLASVLYD